MRDVRERSWVVVLASALGAVALGTGCSTSDTIEGSDDAFTDDEDGEKTGKRKPRLPRPGTEGPILAAPPLTPDSPKLESLEPRSVRVASGSVELTIKGTRFDPNAKVSVDGSDLEPISTSATQIRVMVPSERVVNAASVPVKVHNPPNSGGGSNLLSFTVASETTRIALASVAPAEATAGSAELGLEVSGSGFGSQARVRFNGAEVPTTVASTTTLTAVVPSAMLRLAGVMSVVVFDPAGGGTGALTEPQTFTIGKPGGSCSQSCADFGYQRGQCHLDWTCGTDGCLQQKACVATCDYRCTDYLYEPKECREGYCCSAGCLVPTP
jgi:hypothetical protein